MKIYLSIKLNELTYGVEEHQGLRMTVSDKLPARLMSPFELLQSLPVLPQRQEVFRVVVSAHPPQRYGVLHKTEMSLLSSA